jgi:hypothetical protein
MKEKKREKPREKVPEESEVVKVEEVSQEQTAEIVTQEEMHAPEVVIEQRAAAAVEATQEGGNATIESNEDDIAETHVSVMPSWGSSLDSEWMYGIPPRDEDKALWAEEWSDYLLQWAERNQVHLLSLAVFISEPPFKDLRNKVDSFKIIAQVLIDKEVAEWADRRRRQLRIYWKPLEDWADIIYEWSLKTGKLRLDVKSIIIQESKEAFAKLPENDLYVVMALMVEKGFAEWVDKKRGAVLVTT